VFDDIHIIGPDLHVAAAFASLRAQLATQNLHVSFGASKTSAWSPAWETYPSQATTSAVLGPLNDTTARIHQCTGGIATLGTFIGTDVFVKAATLALIQEPLDSAELVGESSDFLRVQDNFKHACDSVAAFSHFRATASTHSANVLLLKCIIPKISYMLELLPPHLTDGAAKAAHALVAATFCNINAISPEEAAAVFDRLVLPPSLAGCGLRYYPDVSPAAYVTSRAFTSAAVAAAIEAAEAAQVGAASGPASDDATTSSDDSAPAPVRRAVRTQPPPQLSAAVVTTTPPPTTTPLEDIIADINAVLDLLPAAARAEIDVDTIGTPDMKVDKHLQRKLTRLIEEERKERVVDSAKAVMRMLVPGSEAHRAAERHLAHLNSCNGFWLLAPALAHMRISASYYRAYVRRYLRLQQPICNYAGGAGSSRPPRNANTSVDKSHDLHGDYLLSVFNADKQNQWHDLHEQIKHFFFRCAKQVGITSVTMEKRADNAPAESRRRPGDIKIGSTMHGWKAAAGKTLLLDVTTVSAVCTTWAHKAAAAVGGAAKGAADKKIVEVLASGELSENQHFLPLGFESEGAKAVEVDKLLHAWGKLYKETRDASNGDVSLLLFKWHTELAFIRAKFTAKCIVERAAFCAEKQDNEDKITSDVRPPLPDQLHVFTAH